MQTQIAGATDSNHRPPASESASPGSRDTARVGRLGFVVRIAPRLKPARRRDIDQFALPVLPSETSHLATISIWSISLVSGRWLTLGGRFEPSIAIIRRCRPFVPVSPQIRAYIRPLFARMRLIN